MWNILIPIVLLVIAVLFGLRRRERFVDARTTAVSTDASGNPVDASGNIVRTTPTNTSTISLTLADLLTLFKASVPSSTTTETSTPSTSTATQDTTTPAEFYNQLRPQLLDDLTSITRANITGSPYEPSAPLPCDTPFSDSLAQGVELQNANDYIKKDQIPCYGCTL